MKEIQKQSASDLGTAINQNPDLPVTKTQFVKMKGVIHPELLRAIDQINGVLDLQPLEEDQVMVIAQFIQYEFITLTIDQVKDAVFKAKAGKLDCDPNNYQKLTIDFFGRILSAYKEYLKDQHRRPQTSYLAIEERVNKEYSPEQGESAYNFIKDVYLNENKAPYIANWDFAFKYMEETELIKMTDQEKKDKKWEVIDQMKSDIKKLRNERRNYQNEERLLRNHEYVKTQCRKAIIKEYFESIIDTDE